MEGGRNTAIGAKHRDTVNGNIMAMCDVRGVGSLGDGLGRDASV